MKRGSKSSSVSISLVKDMPSRLSIWECHAFHEAGLTGSETRRTQGQVRHGQVAPMLNNRSLHGVEWWEPSGFIVAPQREVPDLSTSNRKAAD